MEVIEQSTADEVILEWLRAELDSDRFGNEVRAGIGSLGLNETIITGADLGNEQANRARWQLLKSYRTWVDGDLYSYDWQRVELDREDVGRLNYIDFSYWNELSDGTRKVARAAANVAKGTVVFDVPNDRFFSVAQAVEAGMSLPPIIIVASVGNDAGDILEGHLRATGYLLANQTQQPLKALWGQQRG